MILLVGRLVMVGLARERVGKGHGLDMRRSCLPIRKIDGIIQHLCNDEEKSKVLTVTRRDHRAVVDEQIILQATRRSSLAESSQFTTLNLR